MSPRAGVAGCPSDARCHRARRRRPAAAADDARLSALVRDHGPRIRAYVAGLVSGTAIDPDDVVQEVWLRAHRFLPEEGNALAWLYTVARNAALDARRSSVRQRRGSATVAEHLPAPRSVAEDVERRLELEAILDDITRLPARQRRALVRHAIDGASHDEVGAGLVTSRAGAKTLVSRARHTLRRHAAARAAA